jgi:hypothetical protein
VSNNPLFVGDCDGNSTGGCHGAGKIKRSRMKWWVFDSGTR